LKSGTGFIRIHFKNKFTNFMSISSARFLTLVLLLAFSCSLWSQLQKNDSLPQVGLQEVVISALRIPINESSVPYSFSLMNAKSNTQGLSLSDALSGLPGLEVNARYNFSVGDRITNRGFGARTQFGVRGIRIFSDDMPVTFADGQSNLEMIDLHNLSTVEFLRGPGSSIYGNASGGVLILHSFPLSNDHLVSSVSTTFGSNGLFQWNGLVQSKIENTHILLNYSDFQYSGFRDHSTAEFKRVKLNINSDLSAFDNLNIIAGYVNFNSLNPGSLTKAEADQDPAKANPASISNAAGQDGNQAQISGTWKHQSDSNTLLKVTVYGVHRSVVNPIVGKIVVLPQYSGGIVAAYNSILDILGKRMNWSAGTELSMRFNNRKNYLNVSGQEGSITINQDEQVIGSGIFLHTVYPVTAKFNIDGCLRYDLCYFAVQNHLAANSGGRNMNALNPSLGLIYHIFNSVSFFANVSTSFETPTSTELVNRPDGAGGFNPDLNPARALEYETGLRGLLNPFLKYDFAVYSIQTKDELIPFQVPVAPGQDYYRNAGSTFRRGAELAFRFFPFSILDLTYSLSYIDAEYKNFVVKGVDYSGNKIPGISGIHQVAELKLHPGKGTYLSFLAENHGKMYVDDANSATSNPHTIFDLGLGNDGLSIGQNKQFKLILSGGISNLFNTNYITSLTINAAANRYFEPGPGRTYFLNAKLEFGVK
jgi:iron complex outermembrane receptor protein